MRQGNDVGTQYRSAIYYAPTPSSEAAARASATRSSERLRAAGYGEITTEIAAAPASSTTPRTTTSSTSHKNPNGYCGLGGTGVSCPIGLGASQAS